MSSVSNGGAASGHRQVTIEQRSFVQQVTIVQHGANNGNGNTGNGGQQKRFGRTSHIMLKIAGGNGALADTTAFANAGKKPGLDIWRVEKLKLIPVPISEYGKFYMFDAYVILFTSQEGDQLLHHAHFWQGEACSQDETTVAAYKTVELDSVLASPLTLAYREVQGHESKQFMSYFKAGLRYIEGSMGGENREFEGDTFVKRLYKVKGKHNCRATQVDLLIQSLNQNEVFVLDAGWNIYLWIGPTSPRHERLKGAEFAGQLRDDEHRGQAYVHVIEQTWDSDEQFFSEFGDGATNGHVIKEIDDQSQPDWQHERREPEEVKLHRVVDKCGKLDAKDVRTRPMSRKLLDTNDCFILDLGNGGIFAWVGRQCPTADTIEIWKLALEYLRFRGLPKWTPICRVKEGYEPPTFIEAFQVWLDPKMPAEPRAKNEDEDGNSEIIKAKDYMPDDGTGEVQIWRVENFYMAPVDKTQYGRFYSADCYVIMYRYVDHEQEKGVVYFWQGANSNPDEKAASAMMAAKVDAKEMNGQAVLVRVIQNKEPAHFLKIFENKMVVLMGGHKSGFKSLNESDCYDADGTRLFQVRDGRVIQVPEKASFLNSSDIFILETPRATYMWHGKTASEDEKKASKDFARRVIPLRNPHMVEEGSEPDEFWHAIGGPPVLPKHSNTKTAAPQVPQCEYPARLYHSTNSIGYFRVEEVVDFDQRDLFDEDIMILDTFDEVFVWIGQNASEPDKKDSIKMAIEFIRTDPYGRQIDNALVVAVKQGFEWPPFIAHFGGRWQRDMWNYVISYDDLKRQFADSNGKLAKMADVLKRNEKVYALEMLIGKEVPEGVDPGRKEFHLSEEDFQRVFQLSRAEYMKLPQWKRVELKKKSGLF